MTYRLIIRPHAEVDIAGAAQWYEKQQRGLGEEFLNEVHSALDRAVANPHVYRCIRRNPEVRRILTRRFPYRIFFILQPATIIVFRVLHNSRDDREWKRNVPSN